MQDFNRRIINEAIKYGAKPRNFHDIGINQVTESQWDENRDGWEGKSIVENDEEGDYNAGMAITQLRTIVEKANDMLSMLTPETELETWVQSKITMADDYITTVRDYMKHEGDKKIGEETLPEATQTKIDPKKYYAVFDSYDKVIYGSYSSMEKAYHDMRGDVTDIILGQELLSRLKRGKYKNFRMSISEVKEEADITEATQTKIGKVTFTPFKEGSISGYTISIEGRGEVGFIEEPAKKNTKTSVAPFKVFYSGKSEGNPDLVLSAWPGSETRQLSPKEIRFKPRGLLQAVAEWMAKNPPK